MRTIGACCKGNNTCSFSVWAPQKKKMLLHLVHPREEKIEMKQDQWGYFRVEVADLPPGSRYFFMPEGNQDFPDPASHYQPEGVHGPSEVVDHTAFSWTDSHWRGLPFKDLVLYELHVGTFTPEGSFTAIIPRLDELKATGINALELMPVAQFPGNRNWGYDGTYPYAVQHSYGGPEGLKQLVDACHQKGIAVFLDVVYNHLGPEGNYFSQFGPYFTNRYCTPWGDALNFDGEWSDGVRDFFSDNPGHWFQTYHIDGLRLDAIHTVFDNGAVPFWELMHEKISELEQRAGRPLYTIAESDLNSPRVVKGREAGGFGFTAQWLDDFHHALYVLLDKKGKDRYADFGLLEQLAKAFTDGFVHSGEYVQFRKRKHGASSAGLPGHKFIAFNQNHDQVGNRVGGERLCMLVDLERQKLAAAAVLLAPYIPMLFMGEEYADESPFFYFVSHSDQGLIEAVQKGRKEEFADYGFEAEPPDPQDEKTFAASRLQWEKRTTGKHGLMLCWHQHLLALRRTDEVLQNFSKNDLQAYVLGQEGMMLHRKSGSEQMLCLFNFSEQAVSCTVPATAPEWTKLLDSKEPQWREEAERSQLMPAALEGNSTIELPPLSVSVYKSSTAEH